VRAGPGDLGGRGDGGHDDVCGYGERFGGKGEGLRVVALSIFNQPSIPILHRHRSRSKHTTAMRNHPRPSNLLNAPLLHEPEHRMERAAHLECADALETLALEEQAYLRRRGVLALPLRALECFWGLRCGCEGRERGVGQDGRAVDVRFDERVCGFDGCARQGGRRREGRCRRHFPGGEGIVDCVGCVGVMAVVGWAEWCCESGGNVISDIRESGLAISATPQAAEHHGVVGFCIASRTCMC
jgi:hypothetical protein